MVGRVDLHFTGPAPQPPFLLCDAHFFPLHRLPSSNTELCGHNPQAHFANPAVAVFVDARGRIYQYIRSRCAGGGGQSAALSSIPHLLKGHATGSTRFGVHGPQHATASSTDRIEGSVGSCSSPCPYAVLRRTATANISGRRSCVGVEGAPGASGRSWAWRQEDQGQSPIVRRSMPSGPPS